MTYVYIKTPTPTSFALFKIHESIEPIIPGKAANALSANLPSSCDRALNL